jgi:glucose/arabinose dehydrogenase
MRRKLSTQCTSLFASSFRRPGKRIDPVRLCLEALEDRLALATLPTGFAEVSVASGLTSPTAMEISPIGELWVLEQSGDVRLVLAGGATRETIDLVVNSTGERGLLGIAFDPTYDGTGPNVDYVYLYYTEPAGPASDPLNNRLSRFTVSGAGTNVALLSLASEVILRDLPPNTEDSDSNHNGGAIHFGPDGKLYVAVGDHNYDGVTQANHVSQINTTPFGKILRLNADGTNPTDNPFYNSQLPDPSTNWEGSIWAKGLRNPYTFSFDPDSGAMFINDVGEGQWEEINRGEIAGNYGWAGSPAPVWEGFENDGTPPPFANYRDPVMAYGHPPGVAITGGVFYPPNGQFGSNYAGLYFFADYGANFIRIFDPDNPGTLANPDTSAPFATTTNNPVDLKIDQAGRLFYLGRGDGQVWRISFTGSFGPTQVVSRQLFYNHSHFDADDPAANDADDSAIAPDKSAYLPGSGLADFGNISSYARGINGIMIDLAGNHGAISTSDFSFKVGANNTPSAWATAPNPTQIVVRAGDGAGGSDRVEVVWANGAIRNTYLQVIVEGNDATGGFNTNTGLASSDVFYFGSRVADSGTSTPAANFQTTSTDAAQVNATITGSATISNLRDFNRSGDVTSTDGAIVNANIGTLRRINIGAAGPFAPEGADPRGGDASGSAVATALAAAKVQDSAPQPAIDSLSRGPNLQADDGPLARLPQQSSHTTRALAQTRPIAFGALFPSAELDDDLLDPLLVDLAQR